MTRTSLMTTTVILLSAITFGSAEVAAQSRAPAPAAAVDQNASDIKALAEQGIKLKADTEAALKILDEKQNMLSALAKDTQGALKFVDDMIGMLRDAAGRVGHDSAYMKTLQTQQDLLRRMAVEAQSSPQAGTQTMGDQLNTRAAAIASLQADAQDVAARLSAEIDRLAQVRPQIRYAYALGKADEFIASAKGYLDTVKAVLQGTSSLAANSESFTKPPVPTN